MIRLLLARAATRLPRLIPLLFATALAACGGGGSSTATNVVAPPAPPAGPTTSSPSVSTLSIAGFAPASGPVDSTVTVTGAGFTAVQTVKLGSLAASFTALSDTQLRFVVPAGAQSGTIELTAPGHTVLSASAFTVSSVPQLASLSPTSVLAGGRVTLSGSNLDRVTQVRVNATTLPIVTQTATLIAADVPAGATTGFVTLVDTDGTARQQSQQLTVVAPMTLSSFTPTSIVTGQALTLNGTNLDRATGVVFAGGVSAAIATRSGTTRVTVTVPDAALTGAVQVIGNAADQVTSASPLTVIPAIRVDAAAVYRVNAAGANVTITGTGLTEVSALTVRGVPATIGTKSATQLVFAVPAGVACGVINLQSTSQPAVTGGSVIVGNGCAATLAGIEFGQVLSQVTTDVRQRLVPGKETWVRAFVVSDQTGLTSPTVRLTGYSGATILGTLTMSGPATLPGSAGGVVSDAIRYDEAQSFNAELPASWAANGLSVRIEVDPEQRLGPTTTQDATPVVGTSTKIDIVLVPVVSGTFIPTLPSAAAVLDELTRRFPIPRSRITVSTRASYTLNTVTDGLDTQTEWSNAVSELRQLRDAENPSNRYRYYFGFVKRSGGSIAGIGYIGYPTALGWDAAGGWQRTMSHELGHNLGRPHAPCGGVASPDANYPYAGGVLSGTPLLDSIPVALDVISPAAQTDIMGYCNGSWFSDYNYQLMQSFLEGQPQAAVALAQSTAAETDMLQVSGSIGVGGVALRPVHALRGRPMTTSGEYVLRLVTRDGRTIEHAFDAAVVDHVEPPEGHFAVAVPNPGALDRIEVRRAGVLLPNVASATATAQRARSPVNDPMTVDWSESAGQLSIRWSAAARFASVTHVVDGQRTVLALHREGGSLVVDTSALPAGGTFEFSLSDGLNAQLVAVQH